MTLFKFLFGRISINSLRSWLVCLIAFSFASMTFVINAQEKTTPVSVVRATTSPLYDEIPLSGTVLARRVSLISPKIEGFVAEVLVDDGDEVKATDPLLRLDRIMAEIELSRSRAQVSEASARLKEAKRQRDEAAELVEKKHIPATSYEAALSEVDISAAILQRLRAELARQEENISRHTIYAPFDGVIAEKLVELGQWVDTGTGLVELVEIDVLRVDVPVPQHYFSEVMVGTDVKIRFDAMPEKDFSGKVSMKIPVGHESARTFPVRIEMDNKDHVMAPGMSARVRFLLSQSDQVLILPRDAVVKKSDGTELVWILSEENSVLKAMPVVVQTGKAYRQNVEIVKGDLKAGDRVVIRGNEILRPGQTVHVAQELEVKF